MRVVSCASGASRGGCVGSTPTTRLGKVARRELAGHRITRHEQLAVRSEGQLLAIHSVGPKVVRVLWDEPVARGLAVRWA